MRSYWETDITSQKKKQKNKKTTKKQWAVTKKSIDVYKYCGVFT